MQNTTPRRIRYRAGCGHIAAMTVTKESKKIIAGMLQAREASECIACAARRTEGDPDEAQREKIIAIALTDEKTAHQLIADQLEAQADLVRGKVHVYDSEENGMFYMLSLLSDCIRLDSAIYALKTIDRFFNKTDGGDHTQYPAFEAGATFAAGSARMQILATFKMLAQGSTHIDLTYEQIFKR